MKNEINLNELNLNERSLNELDLNELGAGERVLNCLIEMNEAAESQIQPVSREIFQKLTQALRQCEKIPLASYPLSRRDAILIECARALNNQSQYLRWISKNNDALGSLDEAQRLLNLVPNLNENHTALLRLGQMFSARAGVHFSQRNYEKSLVDFDKALEIFESIGEKRQYFKSLNAKAGVYFLLDDFSKALEHALLALDFFESAKDKRMTATILHNLSGIYYKTNQNELARQFGMRALEMINDDKDSPQTIDMRNGLGMIESELGALERAIEHFERALDLSRQTKLIDGQIIALAGLGSVNLKQQEYESALGFFQEARALQIKAKSRHSEGDVMLGIALANEKLSRLDEAESSFEQAIVLAEQRASANEIAEAYLGLSRCAEAKGDMGMALARHKRFAAFKEAFSKKESDGRLQSLQVSFLTTQARKESEKLAKYNQRLMQAHDALSDVINKIELQKADLELEYSRIRGLVASLSEGVLIEDEARRVHLVNQRLLKMFGIEKSAEEWIGKNSDRLRVLVRKHVRANKAVQELFERFFYERKPMTDQEMTLLDGKSISVSFIPLFANNHYRGSLWSFEDITLRKNIEKEREMTIQKLNEANQTLKQANDFKNELIGIAAHDLKNPLSLVGGFAALIKEERQDAQTVLRYADEIINASNRMLNLIQDLLSTSASQSSQVKLNFERVDFNAIVSDAVSVLKLIAQEKAISIEVNLEENCAVIGDATKLYEVVENLVNNAIKYSPPHKSIAVSLLKAPVQASRMRRKSDRANQTESSNFTVQLAVKDEGQGLTQEDMQRLFNPFQRLSSKPTGGEHSSGLGLYIVKTLVERHNGKVWAESEGKGKGATFVIELLAAP
jgi:signal transduction histidine kinase/tetratricopeptide (TPR) repeat protein